MENINVLITGVAGNIGSSLAKALLNNEKINVIGIDNFLTGSRSNVETIKSNKFNFIKADVNNYNDISAIMLSRKIEYVYHYAAVVGVRRTLDNPLSVLQDLDGIRNILSLSRCIGVKRVFFSSSSEVYGESTNFPQNELNTPLNSRLPYAIVKNVCESYLRSFEQEYNLKYTIFRFFNTYGPRQTRDFVIPHFIDLALKGKPLSVYGDGKQTRTFLFIDDNIETTIKCLNENLLINDVLNIGSPHEVTIKELAEIIIDTTKSKSKIVYHPVLPEGDMSRRQPDNSKMMAILGRPLVSLEEGLLRTTEWLRSNSEN